MKRKVLFLLPALLLSFCTLSFGATLQSLDKKGVTNALQDKTITTFPVAAMRNQMIMSRVSIYFGNDGKLEGKLARKPENHPQNDMGTWNVKSDGLLCLNWTHWSQGKETCSYIYDLKNVLLFTNAAGGFDNMVFERFIRSGNHVEEIKSMGEMKGEMKKMREMRMKNMEQNNMGQQPAGQTAQ